MRLARLSWSRTVAGDRRGPTLREVWTWLTKHNVRGADAWDAAATHADRHVVRGGRPPRQAIRRDDPEPRSVRGMATSAHSTVGVGGPCYGAGVARDGTPAYIGDDEFKLEQRV